MSEKVNINLKSLKLIFNQNKPYVLPVVIVIISIIIFFQFVIPQFGTFLAISKEAKEVSLKLETAKENLQILTNINEETLDSQVKILSQALPLNKDFAGMLNAIYSAAQKTGVRLGSFSLKIGDLAKPENSDDFPLVNVSLPISSGVNAVNSFVDVITRSVPLSKIYFVRISNLSSMVSLSFYYKPLGNSSYNQDDVSPVSQKGLTLIDKLSKFENTSLTQ